jgi:hypothetical protein
VSELRRSQGHGSPIGGENDAVASLPHLTGLPPIDVLRTILKRNPSIAAVNLWAYEGDVPWTVPSAGSDKVWLDRSRVLAEATLQEICAELGPQVELGVFSKVRTGNGGMAHIPMMDFRISNLSQPASFVERRLREEGVDYPGWILDSGASYHYYGCRLISADEWIVFVGRCLLTGNRVKPREYKEVADSRHVGHSLKQGGNVLRITANSPFQRLPAVVARI